MGLMEKDNLFRKLQKMFQKLKRGKQETLYDRRHQKANSPVLTLARIVWCEKMNEISKIVRRLYWAFPMGMVVILDINLYSMPAKSA